MESVHGRRVTGTSSRDLKPVRGSEFVEEADLCLVAIGFTHPAHDGLITEPRPGPRRPGQREGRRCSPPRARRVRGRRRPDGPVADRERHRRRPPRGADDGSRVARPAGRLASPVAASGNRRSCLPRLVDRPPPPSPPVAGWPGRFGDLRAQPASEASAECGVRFSMPARGPAAGRSAAGGGGRRRGRGARGVRHRSAGTGAAPAWPPRCGAPLLGAAGRTIRRAKGMASSTHRARDPERPPESVAGGAGGLARHDVVEAGAGIEARGGLAHVVG